MSVQAPAPVAFRPVGEGGMIEDHESLNPIAPDLPG